MREEWLATFPRRHVEKVHICTVYSLTSPPGADLPILQFSKEQTPCKCRTSAKIKNFGRCLHSIAGERQKDFRSACFFALAHLVSRADHLHSYRHRRGRVVAFLRRNTCPRYNIAGSERCWGYCRHQMFQISPHGLLSMRTKHSRVHGAYSVDCP